ncbi:hypothetical protein EDC65_4171 [Stella humosa]|uniref:Uncharacterized protein n=1 Tax=Stella humosa TaxID=94 RepID=A0A3N1KP72_9PROT|nr:hypothetical protein [Stella humosa]ROP83523.1 hypothetical protein EDC65_4171 [Stella humosa]BBK33204.1 hypothetical protein STHU_38380 [Stella humosa]
MSKTSSIPAAAPARSLLWWSLAGDAAVSGACGLLMAAGADPLSGLLGLPVPLLRWAGLALLPYALFLAWLARRPAPPRGAVWAVIVLNVLWAADCLILLASGWVAPTGLGIAFVLVQAVTVLAFADLQYLGLRRSAR